MHRKFFYYAKVFLPEEKQRLYKAVEVFQQWKNNADQAYICRRDLRVSASWRPN